ncbi:MAG: DedA family protein [Bradymonadia bacterium]
MESLLSDLMQYITTNAEIAPWIIFGLLLLAGFNLPVSEDLMLLTSALIAQQRPDLMWHLFAGVFAGAYFSDLICYGLGRTLGPKLWQIKWFAKMVDREHVDKIGGFYEKFGPLTLLLGRFIPFGVRNGLFLTAGLSKMRFLKFALSDLAAATITCGLYFWLYFTYGKAMIEVIKQSNVIIFSVALVGVIFVVLKKRKAREQTN